MRSRPVELLKNWCLAFFDPRSLGRIFELPRFFRDYRAFKAQSPAVPIRLVDTVPCLGDRTSRTPFDPHYFFQAAWLARRLAATRPVLHVDVGSSVVMHSTLSAAIDTLFIDYRPLDARLRGLTPIGGSILALPLRTGSTGSLSCLHVIEHIGLGRYGDAIDAAGSVKAARELQRILAPGGILFLSTPVGRERVCFNAHRVFAPGTLQSLFPELETVSFSLVNDRGTFIENATLAQAEHLEYGCGMFEFRKSVA
jgi:SAM-dependent methyltransferase